ncbi:hypothetical protein WA158_003048 [Blastocystis sp. Blastoise]
MSKQYSSFVIWPGSKRRVAGQIADILKSVPRNNNENPMYIEPFIGSGHVFLNLMMQDYQDRTDRKYVISDTNTDLINCWKYIRDYPIKLIVELEKLNDVEDTSDNYYELRKIFNTCTNTLMRCAYFIALNKRCFCGIYSVNQKDEFNTPWGYKRNKNIFNKENILQISSLLNYNNVTILNDDYRDIIKKYPKGIYYMDPPYMNTFDRYSKDKFSNNEFLETVKEMKDAICVYISCSNEMKKSFDDKDIQYTSVLSFYRQNTYVRSKGALYDEYILHINY